MTIPPLAQRHGHRGVAHLRVAVLEVLYEAKKNGECVGGAEIGRWAGIFREGGYAQKQGNDAIVWGVLSSLVKDALLAAGCERIFTEKASGACRDRPRNVSARSTRWPCASSQPPAGRRVIRDRNGAARSGNTQGAARPGNRVSCATIPGRPDRRPGRQPIHLSRGRRLRRRSATPPGQATVPGRPRGGAGPVPPAGAGRGSGGGPSARPGAGAPPASPVGPRPRTAGSPREAPGESGRPACACEPACRTAAHPARERRRKVTGARPGARATEGHPASTKIDRN